MDVITLPLMPRLKFSIKSDARHFLCKACLLLFVQIQNVPETHNDTQMQLKCNYSHYLLFVSELKYVADMKHEIHKSKYCSLVNYIVTVLLVTVLSPW